MEEHAAAQIRYGFADRVLRAARAADVPSLLSQFALSAATAAFCLGAVVAVHTYNAQANEAHSHTDWEQIMLEAQDVEANL